MKKSELKAYTWNLFKAALPLMLSWISTTAMMFSDRFILSRYSLAALGAAVNAGTIVWGFCYGFQIFTETSQVIVAKLRGAKTECRVQEPTWQMIWLSLLSPLLFIPLYVWGAHFFFSFALLQSIYFKSLVIFGPFFGLIGALSGYFIGSGQGKKVLYSALAGNGVNIIFDFFLIFGFKPWIKPLGIEGAAIATGLGVVVQALVLFAYFLKENNFQIFFFKKDVFTECCKYGFPPAIFMGFELIGWGLFFSMMAYASDFHLKITSICQSFLPLLAFVGVGLQKVVSAKIAYEVGAKRQDQVSLCIKSSLIILSVYALILIVFVGFFPHGIIGLYTHGDLGGVGVKKFAQILHLGIIFSSVYLFFGGIRNILSGALSSLGDNRFLLFAGSLSVWLLLLLPCYGFIIGLRGSVSLAQALLMLYGFLVSIMYFLRFKIIHRKIKSLSTYNLS